MDLHFATLFTWFYATWCGNALSFEICAKNRRDMKCGDHIAVDLVINCYRKENLGCLIV
ncbi:hypothetical protein VoSk93_12990 [Vibrio owensii]